MSSAPSTTSSRRRADNNKLAAVPLEEQEEKIYEIAESLKEYLDFNQSNASDIQNFCENYQEFVHRSEIYIGSIWKSLRSSFRINDKESLSEYQQIYINAIKSFSNVLREHKDLLQSYLKNAVEGYKEILTEDTLLYTAISEIDKSTKVYFELLSHQIETTREVRMKKLSNRLEDIYNEEMKLHDACAVDLAYEFFLSMSSILKEVPVSIPKTKQGIIEINKNQSDRDNCIKKLENILYSNESMFAMSISTLLSRFNTQEDYDEMQEEEIYPNDSKSERERKNAVNKENSKVRKANEILRQKRESSVCLILDIFKERIQKIHLMIEDIESIDDDDGEDTPKRRANNFKINFTAQFFDLTFSGLIDFLQKVHQTRDQSQESRVTANICNLVKIMNASAVSLTLKQLADFYASIAGSDDDESIEQIETELQNSLDNTFAELVKAYQAEIDTIVDIGPPTTQEEAEEFQEIATDSRNSILEITGEILPVIVKSAKSFYKAHPEFLQYTEDTQQDEEEEIYEEEEEAYNPFEDFMVYFVELSQKHLRTLIPPKIPEDTKSKISKKSNVSTLSKYSTVRKAENMTAEIERIDNEEKLNRIKQDCIESAVADVGLDIQYIMSAQLTSLILKKAPYKMLSEHQTTLKSIVAQTGALLARQRKVAAASADVIKTQAIDGKISLNQNNMSQDVIKSYEEAMRTETQAWIDKNNSVIAKRELERDTIIEEYKEDLDLIFDRLERNVHVPQLALLEKKILIEEEYAKRKQCDESRRAMELASKLTAQGDYKGAKKAKAQSEALQEKYVAKVLEELHKKHERMREKELEKNAADLDKIEKECREKIRQIRKSFKEVVALNEKKIWANLSAIVQKNTASAAMLIGDERARKSIAERLQKVVIRVLDENDMKYIVPERDLTRKV